MDPCLFQPHICISVDIGIGNKAIGPYRNISDFGQMLISDIADWKRHITMMNVELDVGCTLKLAVWNRAK